MEGGEAIGDGTVQRKRKRKNRVKVERVAWKIFREYCRAGLESNSNGSVSINIMNMRRQLLYKL